MDIQYTVPTMPEVFYTRKYGEDGKMTLARVPTIPMTPDPAIVESISRFFQCQRGSEPIYSSNYGIDWDKFIGKRLDAEVAGMLQHEIREAMLCHPYVKDCATHIVRCGIDSIVVMCAIEIKDDYCATPAEIFGLVKRLESHS